MSTLAKSSKVRKPKKRKGVKRKIQFVQKKIEEDHPT